MPHFILARRGLEVLANAAELGEDEGQGKVFAERNRESYAGYIESIYTSNLLITIKTLVRTPDSQVPDNPHEMR